MKIPTSWIPNRKKSIVNTKAMSNSNTLYALRSHHSCDKCPKETEIIELTPDIDINSAVKPFRNNEIIMDPWDIFSWSGINQTHRYATASISVDTDDRKKPWKTHWRIYWTVAFHIIYLLNVVKYGKILTPQLPE